MKKIHCLQCKDHFSPSSHLRPFELIPSETTCPHGHKVATTFESRAEITARKLFLLGLVGVWLVAAVMLISAIGFAVGLIGSFILGLIGGSLVGWLLYQFAAVPLQLVLEGGKAVGKLSRGSDPEPGAGERLLKFINEDDDNSAR